MRRRKIDRVAQIRESSAKLAEIDGRKQYDSGDMLVAMAKVNGNSLPYFPVRGCNTSSKSVSKLVNLMRACIGKKDEDMDKIWFRAQQYANRYHLVLSGTPQISVADLFVTIGRANPKRYIGARILTSLGMNKREVAHRYLIGEALASFPLLPL